MKIYSILIDKEKLQASNKLDLAPVFIEESFSFSAFIFQSLWLFYNRVWIFGIGLIILDYALMSLFENEIMNSFVFYGIKMAITVFVALFSKGWYVWSLQRKNYQVVDIIAAKDLDEAKLRFYQNI